MGGEKMQSANVLAISIDIHNRKEYVIRSENRSVTREIRPLGTFLLDNERLLTEDFFRAQKHLSLDEMHKYSSYDVFKECRPDVISNARSEFHAFYDGRKLYISANNDNDSLFRYYLDEIYAAGIFPRRCMCCGKIFLSGRKHGNVICSDNCRKKKKSQNTMAYYGKLSPNEIFYNSIYRKWKQRINRAEKKQAIDSDGILRLNQKLQELITVNRALANERKNIDPTDKSFDMMWRKQLEQLDTELYETLDK